MKIITLVLFVFSTQLFANEAFERFNATKNMTNESDIEWRQVSNVQATCESESRKRGLGGFGYALDACSFWDKKLTGYKCYIITAKVTDMATLGHEVRHCFQGAFHH